MTRTRIPIFALMGRVALLALGFALIRGAPLSWAKAVYSLTVLALAMAAVASRVRPAPWGGFWFGYAVFGAIYLMGNLEYNKSMARWVTFDPYSSSLDFAHPVRSLVTEDLMADFADWVAGPEPVQSAFASQEAFNLAFERHFKRIHGVFLYTHLLMAHAMGLIGGMLAVWWTPRTKSERVERKPSE